MILKGGWVGGISVKTNFKAHSGSVEVRQSQPRVAKKPKQEKESDRSDGSDVEGVQGRVRAQAKLASMPMRAPTMRGEHET